MANMYMERMPLKGLEKVMDTSSITAMNVLLNFKVTAEIFGDVCLDDHTDSEITAYCSTLLRKVQNDDDFLFQRIGKHIEKISTWYHPVKYLRPSVIAFNWSSVTFGPRGSLLAMFQHRPDVAVVGRPSAGSPGSYDLVEVKLGFRCLPGPKCSLVVYDDNEVVEAVVITEHKKTIVVTISPTNQVTHHELSNLDFSHHSGRYDNPYGEARLFYDHYRDQITYTGPVLKTTVTQEIDYLWEQYTKDYYGPETLSAKILHKKYGLTIYDDGTVLYYDEDLREFGQTPIMGSSYGYVNVNTQAHPFEPPSGFSWTRAVISHYNPEPVPKYGGEQLYLVVMILSNDSKSVAVKEFPTQIWNHTELIKYHAGSGDLNDVYDENGNNLTLTGPWKTYDVAGKALESLKSDAVDIHWAKDDGITYMKPDSAGRNFWLIHQMTTAGLFVMRMGEDGRYYATRILEEEGPIEYVALDRLSNGFFYRVRFHREMKHFNPLKDRLPELMRTKDIEKIQVNNYGELSAMGFNGEVRLNTRSAKTNYENGMHEYHEFERKEVVDREGSAAWTSPNGEFMVLKSGDGADDYSMCKNPMRHPIFMEWIALEGTSSGNRFKFAADALKSHCTLVNQVEGNEKACLCLQGRDKLLAASFDKDALSEHPEIRLELEPTMDCIVQECIDNRARKDLYGELLRQKDCSHDVTICAANLSVSGNSSIPQSMIDQNCGSAPKTKTISHITCSKSKGCPTGLDCDPSGSCKRSCKEALDCGLPGTSCSAGFCISDESTSGQNSDTTDGQDDTFPTWAIVAIVGAVVLVLVGALYYFRRRSAGKSVAANTVGSANASGPVAQPDPAPQGLLPDPSRVRAQAAPEPEPSVPAQFVPQVAPQPEPSVPAQFVPQVAPQPEPSVPAQFVPQVAPEPEPSVPVQFVPQVAPEPEPSVPVQFVTQVA